VIVCPGIRGVCEFRDVGRSFLMRKMRLVYILVDDLGKSACSLEARLVWPMCCAEPCEGLRAASEWMADVTTVPEGTGNNAVFAPRLNYAKGLVQAKT
jgi:hypothetical protein